MTPAARGASISAPPVFSKNRSVFPSVFHWFFLFPFFYIRSVFFRVRLISERSLVHFFNERVHRLDPDDERSFVNLFVVFLFLGFIPRFF